MEKDIAELMMIFIASQGTQENVHPKDVTSQKVLHISTVSRKCALFSSTVNP